MKKDLSIYNICLASIKRHTMKPYEFKMTRIYTSEKESPLGNFKGIKLEVDEFAICSTEISENIWTILTTRRIITQNESDFFNSKIADFKTKDSKNFKGYGKINYEKGIIELHNGKKTPYFIETGKSSMVMIYGIQTAMQIIPKGEEWIDKTEQRYKNRGFIE